MASQPRDAEGSRAQWMPSRVGSAWPTLVCRRTLQPWDKVPGIDVRPPRPASYRHKHRRQQRACPSTTNRRRHGRSWVAHVGICCCTPRRWRPAGFSAARCSVSARHGEARTQRSTAEAPTTEQSRSPPPARASLLDRASPGVGLCPAILRTRDVEAGSVAEPPRRVLPHASGNRVLDRAHLRSPATPARARQAHPGRVRARFTDQAAAVAA